jgi:hypothetical protein
VTFSVNFLGGPYSRARVEARLYRHKSFADEYAFYGGYKLPESVSAETDITGTVVLNLWPNELGVFESMYEVQFYPESILGKRVWLFVPNVEAANMNDLIRIPPKFRILPPLTHS